jgi:hypothetical protein
LKKKLISTKSDHAEKAREFEEKMRVKNEQIEDLKIQYSEGEFDKLMKVCDKKDRMILELKNENQKLNELKNHYEKILEKYESDVQDLKKRNEELDKGEDVRNMAKTLDYMKLKLKFYENRQEKVELTDLIQEVDSLEKKLQEKKNAKPENTEIIENSIIEM